MQCRGGLSRDCLSSRQFSLAMAAEGLGACWQTAAYFAGVAEPAFSVTRPALLSNRAGQCRRYASSTAHIPSMRLKASVCAGLQVCGQISRGETVLITAAAGGTGQIAVQVAKAAKCHVIALCSSDSKAAMLKQLGADRVVDYKREDLGVILRKEYPKVPCCAGPTSRARLRCSKCWCNAAASGVWSCHWRGMQPGCQIRLLKNARHPCRRAC